MIKKRERHNLKAVHREPRAHATFEHVAIYRLQMLRIGEHTAFHTPMHLIHVLLYTVPAYQGMYLIWFCAGRPSTSQFNSGLTGNFCAYICDTAKRALYRFNQLTGIAVVFS